MRRYKLLFPQVYMTPSVCNVTVLIKAINVKFLLRTIWIWINGNTILLIFLCCQYPSSNFWLRLPLIDLFQCMTLIASNVLVRIVPIHEYTSHKWSKRINGSNCPTKTNLCYSLPIFLSCFTPNGWIMLQVPAYEFSQNPQIFMIEFNSDHTFVKIMFEYFK